MTTNDCKYSDKLLNPQKSTKDLIQESYECFIECMRDETLTFNGKKILFKTEKDLHTMKELGFEHIVSMNNKIGRIYEPNRMIYVPLIKKILSDCQNKTCSHISLYEDNGDICIWCRKNKFLIVLIPRENGYLLNTAYPVIYKRKLYDIEKKANENGF